MSEFSNRRRMMVDTQVRPSDVTKFPIIAAMLAVPREEFVPPGLREAAYVGHNIDLGGNRVVLEARSLAKLLDILDITAADRVLDLGCGMGYSAAVIAEMGARVVAVEEDATMAASAATLLQGKAQVVAGAIAAGAAAEGPYDVIVLDGAIEVLPPLIAAQLQDGGRIGAIFMSGALGTARIGHKLDGKISWRFAFNAAAPVLPGFERKMTFAL